MVDDGNALFDSLYYLSRNPDVLQAGVDPQLHYNVIGWKEGRDPNGFFDTSGYLAVNKDVAAAGINPLDHYHNSGWHEGRDPSAKFDTTRYLIKNPDVAAAEIDPLRTFFSPAAPKAGSPIRRSGPSRTASTRSTTCSTIPTSRRPASIRCSTTTSSARRRGAIRMRGSTPRAISSHYTDVAAAGINPLHHYETIGWKEGRDPSYGFDTLGYLAGNPDVAAAGMNPLDHYLQHRPL